MQSGQVAAKARLDARQVIPKSLVLRKAAPFSLISLCKKGMKPRLVFTNYRKVLTSEGDAIYTAGLRSKYLPVSLQNGSHFVIRCGATEERL